MEIIYTLPHVFVPGSNQRENARVLRISLEYLIALNLDYLKRHDTPPLYRDGIVYQRTVEWETVPAVELRGYADCKSLAAWRIAELRFAGIPAKPVFRFHELENGMFDYHILIQTGPGEYEDPSKSLGMTSQEQPPTRLELDELLWIRSRKSGRK